MISGDTTVARLLDQHPELVEVLASYHPHFKHLRNKLLRRVMAPRVTLAQAARIAGVSADNLLATLRRAVGEPETAAPDLDNREGRGGCEPRPAALSDVPEPRQRHVDVREDVRRNQEPFARIMAAVKGLGPDEVLVLRAPFEPIPLYDVLGKRGFAHWTECHAPDDWSVWFYRRAAGAVGPDGWQGASAGPPERRARLVDVRGLEPPQPMVRVLEELDRLKPGEQIEVLHERRPMFLYPQLDERGFTHETEEPRPGLVRIIIRRGAAAR